MTEQDVPAVTVQAGLASGAADSGPNKNED